MKSVSGPSSALRLYSAVGAVARADLADEDAPDADDDGSLVPRGAGRSCGRGPEVAGVEAAMLDLMCGLAWRWDGAERDSEREKAGGVRADGVVR